MTTKRFFAGLVACTMIGATGVATSFAAVFTGERIDVTSTKSYDQVTAAVKSMVGKNSMMIMAEVDQGKMLSMTGFSLKARVYLIGNPTVGKTLFEQDPGVGLYVPLRLSIYESKDGRTHVAYDKPSSLLSQFENEKAAMTAKMLDEKLESLATMAAQ